jgi:hypothetical protein
MEDLAGSHRQGRLAFDSKEVAILPQQSRETLDARPRADCTEKRLCHLVGIEWSHRGVNQES